MTISGAKPLSDRIALITGASRGIGRAAARALSAAGAHVVLTARTVGGLEEADDEIRSTGGSATLVPLDLRHAEKLDALGPSLYERWGRIDIVVGNAGVLGPLSPLPHILIDAWNEVIDVNLTANFRLIRTLDPLLRKSDAGRAIFVSSGAAGARNAYWGPYAASKAGLEAMVKTYAREIESTTIRANIINPGPIRTGMRAQAFPGENPATLRTPEDIAPLFVRLASPSCTDNGRVFDFKTGEVR